MRLTLLLTACSLLLLTGCGSKVPRPDALLCEYNVPALHKKCYNIAKDYDDSGFLKKIKDPSGNLVTTPATIVQYKTRDEMLDALNKETGLDPDSWAGVKAYIKNLRQEWEQMDQKLSNCSSFPGGG